MMVAWTKVKSNLILDIFIRWRYIYFDGLNVECERKESKVILRFLVLNNKNNGIAIN